MLNVQNFWKMYSENARSVFYRAQVSCNRVIGTNNTESVFGNFCREVHFRRISRVFVTEFVGTLANAACVP